MPKLDHVILDFIVVLANCWQQTTFANDRNVYSQDLAIAASWLGDLHRGRTQQEVASEILSSQTTKHFCDYWRHGEWGEREAQAFALLMDKVKLLVANAAEKG